jgi:hypothetical protein
VHHDSRDARATRFICINHVIHDDHDEYDYPYKTVPDYNSYNEV